MKVLSCHPLQAPDKHTALACQLHYAASMYPVRDVHVDSLIPSDAPYWVPKPSDIDEEGIGCYFRGVWPLIGVRTRETKTLIVWERNAATYVARESDGEEGFDALAKSVELWTPDDDDSEAALPEELQRDGTGLDGLELGVAGLTYALSNAGFYPAASCRSHPGHSWSVCPIVLFAADRRRMTRLKPLVEESHCGLDIESSRGHPLFSVYSRSILELMALAELLFQHRSDFRSLPKTDRHRHAEQTTRVDHPQHPTIF